MESGYTKMTFAIGAKSGENTLIIYDGDFVSTVTFTEAMKTTGYTFSHVFVAPRSEGGMTGFLVTIELTEAFDANKIANYVTAAGTDGVTYANGVWTFAKTATATDGSADFYQDVVISGDLIAWWMEQGYEKMTFALTSKSGEYVVIMYDGGFAKTVTFTEAMKTTGYTFSHVFVAPRGEGGMTGFLVTIELTEAFDVNKIANYVTAAGTDGVTYANGVWTFAKMATATDGSADFYQDVVIDGDLIAYWAKCGYTKMTISIGAKTGESFVLMDFTNPTSVEITDALKTSGYTISHFYVAPRSGDGITGFAVTITLS
ncbi:MAG: hypothetical protein SOT34_01845, partial [Candidatus Borkfalkiaceae bacterium]|nr:hypothetical protein [Christensenellaceae bacterium]